MGKINSRQKGAAGEREASKVWNKILGTTAIRGQQRSGLEQADVVGVHDDIHVEVKRYKSFGIWKFIQQMRRDKTEEQIGVLQFRPDGDTDWYVAVSMSRLVEFCKIVLHLHNKKEDTDGSDESKEGTD